MNLMAAVALRLIELYGQVVNIIAILRPKDGATEMEACARENELRTIEARNRKKQSRDRTNWLGGPVPAVPDRTSATPLGTLDRGRNDNISFRRLPRLSYVTLGAK